MPFLIDIPSQEKGTKDLTHQGNDGVIRQILWENLFSAFLGSDTPRLASTCSGISLTSTRSTFFVQWKFHPLAFQWYGTIISQFHTQMTHSESLKWLVDSLESNDAVSTFNLHVLITTSCSD